MANDPPRPVPPIVRLPLDTSAEEARDRLAETGASMALVCDGTEDIGVVTLDEASDAAARHPKWSIARILHREVVSIDPTSGDLDTLSTYRDAAWQSVRRRNSTSTSRLGAGGAVR